MKCYKRKRNLFYTKKIYSLNNIKEERELENKYVKAPVVIKKPKAEVNKKDKVNYSTKEVAQNNRLDYATKEEE
jgi:hypothetical protein